VVQTVFLWMQAKLKAEYEKMERKLREMESRLDDSHVDAGRYGADDADAADRQPVSSSASSMNGSRQ
jgi:hypothetical protein